MARLVGFGDSFTQGVGLEAHINIDIDTSRPSRLAWPTQTANILSLPGVNKGFGGASYQQITGFVTEFPFTSDDIVCVMWTPSMYRFPVFVKTPHTWESACQFGPWSTLTAIDDYTEKEQQALSYYTHKALFHQSFSHDRIMEHAMLIHLADLHIKQYTQNVVHANPVGSECNLLLTELNLPFLANVNFLDFDLLDDSIQPVQSDYDDHLHPAQHAHFSKKLAEYIQENFLTK